MAARAIASGTISFGLVSIPIKMFTAASSKQVRFNMLSAKTGSRLKMQYYDPVADEVIDRKETVKGYEYSRGQYVKFSDEELKELEADRTGSIEITEFVPLSAVDLVQVEKSYYLGPDKGGDKAYRLLCECMRERERVAIGRHSARGKEQLVMIRPYQDGLLLHQLYYANEVRAFDEIDTGAELEFSDVEKDLALKLIDQLSSDQFDSSKYEDDYAKRVLAAVDQKVAGEEITVAPEQPKAQIIDLFEALKRSLTEGADEAKAAEAGGSDEDAAAEVKPKPIKKAKARSSKKKASKKKATG